MIGSRTSPAVMDGYSPDVIDTRVIDGWIPPGVIGRCIGILRRVSRISFAGAALERRTK